MEGEVGEGMELESEAEPARDGVRDKPAGGRCVALREEGRRELGRATRMWWATLENRCCTTARSMGEALARKLAMPS